MASGEDSALGRRSAGQHWGISRHYAPLIDVVVPRQRRAQDGIKLLASRGLLHGDVTVHDGIPVTTVARTLVDLADVLTPHQLTRVIREAEFRGSSMPPTPPRRRSGHAGLPAPRSDARVAAIEVDFSWRGLALVVEIDGGSHLLKPVRRDDDWLRGAGYTVRASPTSRSSTARTRSSRHWPDG